jgi:hypothetical protein
MRGVTIGKLHKWAFPLVTVAVFSFGGCAGEAQGPNSLFPSANDAARVSQPAAHSAVASGYVYVSNRAQNGASQLLVYRAGLQNPPPIYTVTQKLVDAGSVAVDPSGNVYVANGSGGNVIEYSPGATSIVQTYSLGLVHPAGVTVANNTLYVADQGNASNGYAQQIFEYTIGNGSPLTGISGAGGPSQLNEGIAVNPLEKDEGPFYVSASSLTGMPPVGCFGTYVTAKNVLPTLWMTVLLSNNHQAWGMAFDSKGRLYVTDPCQNEISVYANIDYAWTYNGNVPGTFSAPLFLTINDDMLAIPSSRGPGNRSGFVTIKDLSNKLATITITNSLEHPVGAAVAPGAFLSNAPPPLGEESKGATFK